MEFNLKKEPKMIYLPALLLFHVFWKHVKHLLLVGINCQIWEENMKNIIMQ